MNRYYLATTAVYSIQIPQLAYKILCCLQSMADYQTRVCWPKYQTLATRCGCSKRSAMRAVRILCNIGLLEKRAQFEQRRDGEGRRQKENLYVLIDFPQVRFQKLPPQKSVKKSKTNHHALPSHLQKNVTTDFSVLTGSALLVYNYLTLRAGKEKSCWLSKAEIASACGISATTVFRAVKKLTSLGLLDVTAQTRRQADGSNGTWCNRYTLRTQKNQNLPRRRVSQTAKLRLLVLFFLARKLCYTPHATSYIVRVTPPHCIVDTPRTFSQKNNIEKRKPKSQAFLKFIGGRVLKFFESLAGRRRAVFEDCP